MPWLPGSEAVQAAGAAGLCGLRHPEQRGSVDGDQGLVVVETLLEGEDVRGEGWVVRGVRGEGCGWRSGTGLGGNST